MLHNDNCHSGKRFHNRDYDCRSEIENLCKEEKGYPKTLVLLCGLVNTCQEMQTVSPNPVNYILCYFTNSENIRINAFKLLLYITNVYAPYKYLLELFSSLYMLTSFNSTDSGHQNM